MDRPERASWILLLITAGALLLAWALPAVGDHSRRAPGALRGSPWTDDQVARRAPGELRGSPWTDGGFRA